MAIDPSGIEQYNDALKPNKPHQSEDFTLSKPGTCTTTKIVFRKKKSKTNDSGILSAITNITENDVIHFRNSDFDNTAVELLTSGHRRSFEFLEEVILTDQQKHGGNLINDAGRLSILQQYFVHAEDFGNNGRLNKVSTTYIEAAKCEAFNDLYWLQEMIILKALDAATKYKADGGRQQAYCQLLLSQLLETTKVRKLKNRNMIYGNEYMVKVSNECSNLLGNCLEKSLGRSHWSVPENANMPMEIITAGHLARIKLAQDYETLENLLEVIKLSEQAGCIWLESLGNYYLSKMFLTNDPNDKNLTDGISRLERILKTLSACGKEEEQNNSSWTLFEDENSCMRAPSIDKLAGLCTSLLCQIKLTMSADKNSAEECLNLLQDYLNNFQELNLERANGYNLLGEIYDRYFNKPDEAVDCYNKAFEIDSNSNKSRINIGVSNGHLILDGIMRLYENDVKSTKRGKASKRLLIWKDQPDEWQHEMESDE